jgi:hypothetical protein
MTLLDRIFLLATGLIAIYMLYRFVSYYRKTGAKGVVFFMISFAVLLVAGLLLIIFTYTALESPFVIIVAVLIPAGLATGLVAKLYPKYATAYLTFAVVGLLAIAITRFTGPDNLATVVLIIVHSISGLTIFFLPIFAVNQGRATPGFIFVTIGGALIGLGGIALAFLKTGRQLLFLDADFVFTILAPLLLLMTLAFTWGFVKQIVAEGLQQA